MLLEVVDGTNIDVQSVRWLHHDSRALRILAHTSTKLFLLLRVTTILAPLAILIVTFAIITFTLFFQPFQKVLD
jgi:hypothetical protein